MTTMADIYRNSLHDGLDNIEQTSRVEAYFSHFEAIKSLVASTHPWLPEIYFADRFIYGLRKDIQPYVLSCKPCTVLDAYDLACIYELSRLLSADEGGYVVIDASDIDNLGATSLARGSTEAETSLPERSSFLTDATPPPCSTKNAVDEVHQTMEMGTTRQYNLSAEHKVDLCDLNDADLQLKSDLGTCNERPRTFSWEPSPCLLISNTSNYVSLEASVEVTELDSGINETRDKCSGPSFLSTSDIVYVATPINVKHTSFAIHNSESLLYDEYSMGQENVSVQLQEIAAKIVLVPLVLGKFESDSICPESIAPKTDATEGRSFANGASIWHYPYYVQSASFRDLRSKMLCTHELWALKFFIHMVSQRISTWQHKDAPHGNTRTLHMATQESSTWQHKEAPHGYIRELHMSTQAMLFKYTSHA